MRRIALLLILALIACETREHAEAELGALDKAKKAARAAAAHANTAQSEEIGVPACDKYARAYESCLAEKVPENQREDLQAKFNVQRNKWRDEVVLGHPTEPVEEQCRSAIAEAQRSMSQYGCVF